MPMVFTITLPMMVCLFAGLLFPLWSLPLFFWHSIGVVAGVETPGALQALVFGASLHAKVWEYLSLLCIMTVCSLFARKWLWELQSYGSESQDILLSVGQLVSAKYAADGRYHDAVIVAAYDGTVEVGWCDIRRYGHTHVAVCDVRIIAGSEPHGPDGFKVGCYTICISVPIIFATGSLTVVAIGLYLGKQPLPQMFKH